MQSSPLEEEEYNAHCLDRDDFHWRLLIDFQREGFFKGQNHSLSRKL